MLRIAMVTVALGIALPASAAEMKPEEARRFVAGKMFAYTCFDGTTGQGRIYADGSVAGNINIRGAGPARYVVLPANTIKVSSSSICASVRGVPFQPCFNVSQTSQSGFRGSLSGFSFAYCDFVRINSRFQVAGANGNQRARIIQATTTESVPVKPVVAEALPAAGGDGSNDE